MKDNQAPSPDSFTEGEGQRIELKECSQGRLSESVARTISAFSNADGGLLILGIKDNGQLAGLNNQELDNLQKDLVSQCKSIFNIEIQPVINKTENYLIVNIPPVPAQLRPIYIKKQGINKGTYIRVASVSTRATDNDIKRLSIAALGGAENIVLSNKKYLAYLDIKELKAFVDLLNSDHNNIYQSFTFEEVLVKQKIIDQNDDITYFGLLAFAKEHNLQEITSPAISMSLTLYRGGDIINPDDLEETYLEDIDIKGNIVKQFKDSLNILTKKLLLRSVVSPQSGFRYSLQSIPVIALREVLANSLIHRDYSIYGAKIHVNIYADRLEVTNPGESLIPIHRLDKDPSITRNPLLLAYMKEIKLAEQKARGIRTIKTSLKKAGLPEPRFENLANSFKVTIYKSTFMLNTDPRWLEQLTRFNLNQRQINGLICLKNNPKEGIANADYRQINRLDKDDVLARKDIMQLLKLKLIYARGKYKSRRYYLNSSNFKNWIKDIEF